MRFSAGALSAAFATAFMMGVLPAMAEDAPAAQGPDYSRLTSPGYLSAMAGHPVHVFDEKAVGADFARHFQDMTGVGDRAKRAERHAMIPEGGRRLLEALKQADPAAGEAVQQYPGLLDFMVDSASVRTVGTVMCVPAPVDCLAYLPKQDLDDAAMDRAYHIGGRTPVSHARIFTVLDVWSQLLMESDEGRVKFATREPDAKIFVKPGLEAAIIERAKAEGLATDAALDDYYMARFVSDLHDELMGHEVVSYYQNLRGDADPAAGFQDLYTKAEAFREQLRAFYKDAWDGKMPIEQARANAAAFLDKTLASGRAPQIDRFIAAVVLKYYDHSDMPRSEAGLALGIYDKTLGDVVKSLRAALARPSPARPGLDQFLPGLPKP